MMSETKTQRRRRQRATRAAGGLPWNGGKWIRPEKRLRIYARDEWKCVWCGCGVVRALIVTGAQRPVAEAMGVRLATLDHVLPRTRGGSNDASNLVTACAECNEARGDRCALDWAWDRKINDGDWESAGDEAARILNRVVEAMGRELPPPVKREKAA